MLTRLLKKKPVSEEKVITEESKKVITEKIATYNFYKSKTEQSGNLFNKMDLYYLSSSGKLDIIDLKGFCIAKKQEFVNGTFYFIVFFDHEKNAVFPKNPFTATYGGEEKPMKHIKAIYEYNRLNGYSILTHYSTNMLQGKGKMEKI